MAKGASISPRVRSRPAPPIKSKGFAESELWDIESLMRDNMHNIYDQIRGEGAWA